MNCKAFLSAFLHHQIFSKMQRQHL